MTTIATICARGGSVGVQGKNIKLLMGKPLIVHTIEQAKKCTAIERVFVSTDDTEIAKIALAAGAEVPFIRPAELATSSAPKIPVIVHLVEQIEKLGIAVDRIVDLDPTSPLREQSDIDTCISLLDAETDAVITAYLAEKNPYFNMIERKPDGNIDVVCRLGSGLTSRQQAPSVYSMNASIYVWHRQTLRNGLWGGRLKLHVMPRERSIDIDEPLDFKIVELLMAERLSVRGG